MALTPQHKHNHSAAVLHPEARPAEVPGPTAVGDGVIYTCPMHPQIRQVGPGNCPICGMTLEPLAPSATEAENPELRDMTRRFWVALVLTVPLLLLAMGDLVPGFDPRAAVDKLATSTGLPHWMNATWAQCIEALLATPVVLWAGWPFLERGCDFQRAPTALGERLDTNVRNALRSPNGYASPRAKFDHA